MLIISNKSLVLGAAIVIVCILLTLAITTTNTERAMDNQTASPISGSEENISLADVDAHKRAAVTTTTEQTNPAPDMVIGSGEHRYIEVTTSCDHNWRNGQCVVARSQPHFTAATTTRLRQGIVLRVDDIVSGQNEQWYKVTFDDQVLHYPERVTSDWYVPASQVTEVYAPGIRTSWENDVPSSTNKRIVIDKSEQRLYAYEGETVFLETAVSTGLELSPTTVGTFTVFKKTPNRYMQGPLNGVPASDYYDLPGVPWNLYFTTDGAVIHGAYWHNSFGQKYSHGCVNVPPPVAKKLFEWTPLTTTVVVQN